MIILRHAFLLVIVSLATTIIPAQQPPVEVKEAVAPNYPPIAVAARVTGEVVVRVEIGTDGAVLKAEVVRGPAMLQQSAIQTAKKWIFSTDSTTLRVSTIKFSYVLSSENDQDEVQTVFLPPDAITIKHRPMKQTVNY